MFDSSNLEAEKVYTVLELNNTVRKLIKSEFPEYIWVCGEIKDLRIGKNRRHIYFNLIQIQKHHNVDEIVAKVSAAIFEGRKQRIFKRIEEAEGSFELKNDIEVKFLCEVDLYSKSGNYNLIITDIDPIYTLGKLAQNRQRIIEDLKKKNLLGKNKLLQLPYLPLRIGLITSYESAAYHDFISELKESSFSFKVFLCNCHMQGKSTEADVIRAVNFLNSIGKDKLDVIVITRGGGSSADLSWFDNERIAYAIAGSKLPVLTALGHEINVSIADLVAHTSLKTPTKAAQFLTEKINDAWSSLKNAQSSLFREVGSFIDGTRHLLERELNRVNNFVSIYFRDHHDDLIRKKSLIFNNVFHNLRRESYNILMSSQKVSSSVSFHLRALKSDLAYRNNLVTSEALRHINKQSTVISEYFGFINKSSKIILENNKKNISFVEGKISILNPLNIMRRGYSVSYKDGKSIKSSARLSRGDSIKTIFFEGKAFSYIDKIEEV